MNISLMNPWIAHPLVLSGPLVELRPLAEYHIDELVALAQDKRIWSFYAINGSDPEQLRASLQAALTERASGLQYPFVIISRQDGRLIGSTRLLELQPAHRKLEIGWTWLHPDYWGTGINSACKSLLLSYCFGVLQTVRVQLKTDERNLRSRRAIEKTGARFEGIFRNDMIRDDLTKRNSAYYSITDEDWSSLAARTEG